MKTTIMKTMSKLFGFILLSLVFFPLGLSGAASSSAAPELAPATDSTTSTKSDALGVTPSYQAKLSQLHDPEAIRQLLYPSLKASEGEVRYPVSQQTVHRLMADLARLYAAHQLTVVEHPVVGAGLQMEGAAAQAFRGLGLQNGDLLVTLNGCTFMSTDIIPNALDVLSRARIINVRAVRGDDLIAFHYTVENE